MARGQRTCGISRVQVPRTPEKIDVAAYIYNLSAPMVTQKVGTRIPQGCEPASLAHVAVNRPCFKQGGR